MENATLQFLSGWREIQAGIIRPGGMLVIEYDPERLPQCRMNWRGAEVWDIEVYVRFHPHGQLYRRSMLEKISADGGIVVQSVPRPYVVEVPLDAHEVELWFRNCYQLSSRCEAWDSRYGQNYRFPVVSE